MIEWQVSPELVPYPDAIEKMEARVAQIVAGDADEQLWLLQHPPVYTAGTSANSSDLLSDEIPVYEAGRGGQYTYHGPGQRVVYLMLNLQKRQPDLRLYIQTLEQWIINTLAEFDVVGQHRPGRIGIWVETDSTEKKIAAIGVRIRRWVTFHGIAINVNPDLTHFNGIVPCGIKEYGVTSLHDLGIKATMAEVDSALERNFLHNRFLNLERNGGIK